MSENPARFRLDLAVENWLDIFRCIPRPNLANRIGLASRLFASIANVRLHVEGKFTLGPLHFESEVAEADEAEGELWPSRRAILWSRGKKVPLAEVPMPGNIVQFELLTISHVDGQVLAMLGHLRPLLGRVQLWLDYDEDVRAQQSLALALLAQVAPLLDVHFPVNSLQLPCSDVLQHVQGRFLSLLASSRLIYFEEFLPLGSRILDILSDWLNGTEEAGAGGEGPRTLACVLGDSNARQLFQKLQREFLAASCPASFLLRLNAFYLCSDALDPFLDRPQRNEATDELMEFKRAGHFILGIRRPANSQPWLEQTKAEVLAWDFDKQHGRIALNVQDS